MQKIPRLLLILDGLGDRPVVELNNNTPLQAACLPVLDKLAKEGQCGIAHPIKPGIVATTVSGTLAILGFDPIKFNIARGVVEAYGSGLQLFPGDIAFRGNWATIDHKGKIIDRRAGRIREGTKELSSSLCNLKIEDINVLVAKCTEHRVAIVLRGENLVESICGSDPGDSFPNELKPIVPYALKKNDEKSYRTAKLLNLFEIEARKILENHPINLERSSKKLLPANTVLTREAGKVHFFPKIKHLDGFGLKGVCITGDDTISGIAKITGLDVCKNRCMTANLDTDLGEKFKLAKEKLENYGIVVLHIKGCDIAAHNKEPQNKKKFIEKIDFELGQFLKNWNNKLRIAVAADHSTCSKKGIHVDDPVPVMITGCGIKADFVKGFDEIQVQSGKIGFIRLHKLWEHFLD